MSPLHLFTLEQTQRPTEMRCPSCPRRLLGNPCSNCSIADDVPLDSCFHIDLSRLHSLGSNTECGLWSTGRGSRLSTLVSLVWTQRENTGNNIGFLISPWIVDAPARVSHLLYLHFCLATLAGLLVVAYFPAEPPSPPSPAARSLIDQTSNYAQLNSLGSYMESLRQCFTSPSFILLCSIGGILGGAFAAWTSLFANILSAENFNERQAGWLGFSCSLAAIIGGLCSSALADTHYFHRSFKSIIVITLSCCFFALLWFQLSVRTIFSTVSFLPATMTSIALSVTFAGFFQGSAGPLIYEALSETMYPLPESLSASFLVQLNNVTAVILIFLPPDLYKLMNFLVLLSIGSCVAMASLVRIDYKRRNEDERKQ